MFALGRVLTLDVNDGRRLDFTVDRLFTPVTKSVVVVARCEEFSPSPVVLKIYDPPSSTTATGARASMDGRGLPIRGLSPPSAPRQLHSTPTRSIAPSQRRTTLPASSSARRSGRRTYATSWKNHSGHGTSARRTTICATSRAAPSRACSPPHPARRARIRAARARAGIHRGRCTGARRRKLRGPRRLPS